MSRSISTLSYIGTHGNNEIMIGDFSVKSIKIANCSLSPIVCPGDSSGIRVSLEKMEYFPNFDSLIIMNAQ